MMTLINKPFLGQMRVFLASHMTIRIISLEKFFRFQKFLHLKVFRSRLFRRVQLPNGCHVISKIFLLYVRNRNLLKLNKLVFIFHDVEFSQTLIRFYLLNHL